MSDGRLAHQAAVFLVIGLAKQYIGCKVLSVFSSYMVANTNQQEQFSQAYDQYADAIFRYCYYRVFDREQAKDVMQEAFCKTWKYLADGKHIDNIRAFLYRTANNLIIDNSRKKKSISLEGIMEKGFTPSSNPKEKQDQHFAVKDVMTVVQSLEDKYRDVIILKYIEGLSTKEIALLTGEKENNIHVRISRALEKVRHMVISSQ